jgi:prevent-host-death family protein
MKLSEDVKPISYIKSHASEIIRDLSEENSTIVITLNGEAKAILQDIREYEKVQESLAMLKILAHSGRNLKAGKTRPAKDVFRDIRAKTKGSRQR